MKDNIVKTIKVLLIACFMIFPLSLTNVYAAEYQVVFKAGAHGEVNGNKNVTYTLPSGSLFPNEPIVEAKEGYVFTGWSKELPSVGSKVTGKQVYVAQYDVVINGISYIVRYVDEQSVAIATAKTMMAESGSQVMERAKIIPGYTYQIAQQEVVISNTNKEITFVYTLTNPEERVVYEEEIINVPGPGQGQTTTNPAPNPSDNNVDIEDNDVPQGGVNQEENNEETIEDPEIPLGKKESSMDTAMLYGGIALVIICLGAVLIIKNKKKKI